MKLLDNEQVGSSFGMAFVDWSDDSKPDGLDGELRQVESPRYSPEAMAFGDFVRMVRVASGRSIHQAATDLGLTAGRYCDIERGKARPESHEDVRKLVEAVSGVALPEPKIFEVAAVLGAMNKNPPRWCKMCRREHTADSSCWRPKP